MVVGLRGGLERPVQLSRRDLYCCGAAAHDDDDDDDADDDGRRQ